MTEHPPLKRKSKFGPDPGTNKWHRGRRKLSTDQIAEMVKEYIEGATQTALAVHFSIAPVTVQKYLKQAHVLLPRYRPPRENTVVDAPQKKLGCKKGPKPGRINPHAADAPKHPLIEKGVPFLKSDTPIPDTAVHDTCSIPKANAIISEGKDSSTKENLLWAIESAGKLLRTGIIPTTCPNDSAFFLYQQACEQPKDFLTKFLQVEGRSMSDDDNADLKKETKQSLSMIQDLLDDIDEKE